MLEMGFIELGKTRPRDCPSRRPSCSSGASSRSVMVTLGLARGGGGGNGGKLKFRNLVRVHRYTKGVREIDCKGRLIEVSATRNVRVAHTNQEPLLSRGFD